MDAKEFREFGRAAVDFVADYLENIRDRFVIFYFARGGKIPPWFFVAYNEVRKRPKKRIYC